MKKQSIKPEDTLLDIRIDELVEQHGSLRAVSRVLGVDPAYLSRLRRGEKFCPSDNVLRKMGLLKLISVTYHRRSPVK